MPRRRLRSIEANGIELNPVHNATPLHLYHENVSRSSSLISEFNETDSSSQDCEIHIDDDASTSAHQLSTSGDQAPFRHVFSGSSQSQTGSDFPDRLRERLMVWLFLTVIACQITYSTRLEIPPGLGGCKPGLSRQ